MQLTLRHAKATWSAGLAVSLGLRARADARTFFPVAHCQHGPEHQSQAGRGQKRRVTRAALVWDDGVSECVLLLAVITGHNIFHPSLNNNTHTPILACITSHQPRPSAPHVALALTPPTSPSAPSPSIPSGASARMSRPAISYPIPSGTNGADTLPPPSMYDGAAGSGGGSSSSGGHMEPNMAGAGAGGAGGGQPLARIHSGGPTRAPVRCLTSPTRRR